MNILITGSNGFLGRNLSVHLSERKDVKVDEFIRGQSDFDLQAKVKRADFIFHLAGVNRPVDPAEFQQGNTDLTRKLAGFVSSSGGKKRIIYTSSIQASLPNPYGESKRQAEEILTALAAEGDAEVSIFRLPNVFGKWSRPNYNSVVATFCHNISRGIPIKINDPEARVDLVYVDDVVSCFLEILDGARPASLNQKVDPEYSVSVVELAEIIRGFVDVRDSLIVERVGDGLLRALYATYVSFLPAKEFSYKLPSYKDERGVFVEMLKTRDSGQFSFFTAQPGVTRGGHYHHTKSEKFLVLKGKARFRFRHIVSDDEYELCTSGENPEVVETVPGWTHDITNIGEDVLYVMLWANENFDREKPDTYACPL